VRAAKSNACNLVQSRTRTKNIVEQSRTLRSECAQQRAMLAISSLFTNGGGATWEARRKSNVCNLVAVYKWWWGNVGSKTKEQSRTRTNNRVEQSRTM
jgi:hypothetical protein